MDIQTETAPIDVQPQEAATSPVATPSMTDAYKDEAPAPVAEPEQDTGAAADPADDNDAGDDNAGDDTGEEQPAEVEPIAAPTSWSKDAKEVFTKLAALGEEGRALAETITKREADREKFVQSKSREAANTRHAVETEARQALSTIMDNHQRALSQFLPEVPPMPDPRLLQSPEHRDIYFQQKAEYDFAVAQRDHVSQQLEQARYHAQAVSQQQLQVEIQAEHAVLEEALGDEWSDPSSRAKLLSVLEPIAAELGYPKEVMAEARAADIIALRRIGDLKAKADKYDQLMKKRMEPVRAAKQPLPPAARPGAQAGQSKPRGTLATLYPDDVPRN